MSFKKYIHVERFGNVEVEGIELGECSVFPKIDGCFDYKTRILIEDGTYKSIGEIVNKKLKLNVLSYDIKNQRMVTSQISNWFKYPCRRDEWLTVITQRTAGGLRRGGGRNTQLLCTKNHGFIVDVESNIVKQAEDLKVGDYVYVPQLTPTEVQRQIILGTLLGDGFAYPNNNKIYCNGVAFSHSTVQESYVDFKVRLLGNLYNTRCTLVSGYGTKMISVRTRCDKITQTLYELCYKNNKKTVSVEWLKHLNTLGIAIWYMDDGSLSKSNVQRDRAIFHVEGFTCDEQHIILGFFKNRGYDCYISKAGNYNIIVFSPEGTEHLFFDICQYIIPEMQYKLSIKYRNRFVDVSDDLCDDNKLSLKKRKIVNIIKGKKECYHKQGQFKYDLEIKNTHTYFAGNVLVHNSNGSCWVENGEICCGSRNRRLYLTKDNQGFMQCVTQDKRIENYFKEFPEHRLFMEWMVPHSLKTYRQDAWRKFYIFDVAIDLNEDEDGYTFIPYQDYEEGLKRFGLDYISPMAIIKNGSYEQFINQLNQNVFLIEDGKGVGEGIVIKNYDYHNRFGRQTWAKIVTSEFKEKHSKEMGAPAIQGSKMVEEEITENYCTEALIEKVYAKIINEESGWSSKFIPRLLNTVFHDIIVEDMWDICKKMKNPTVNFKTLNHFVINKIKEVKLELF